MILLQLKTCGVKLDSSTSNKGCNREKNLHHKEHNHLRLQDHSRRTTETLVIGTTTSRSHTFTAPLPPLICSPYVHVLVE